MDDTRPRHRAALAALLALATLGCGRSRAPAPPASVASHDAPSPAGLAGAPAKPAARETTPTPTDAPPTGASTPDKPALDLALADLRWVHRPLLLFAPAPSDRELAAQRAALRGLDAELNDREMVLIVVEGAQGALDGRPLSPAAVQRLRARFRPQAGRLTAILVGKDGGEKLRRVGGVSPDEVFRVIDAMPMRQSEMRRRR